MWNIRLQAPTLATILDKNVGKNGRYLHVYLFILFIYNNFICNNQYKKAAIREELNPHVRWPPKNIYKAIKEI